MAEGAAVIVSIFVVVIITEPSPYLHPCWSCFRCGCSHCRPFLFPCHHCCRFLGRKLPLGRVPYDVKKGPLSRNRNGYIRVLTPPYPMELDTFHPIIIPLFPPCRREDDWPHDQNK